MNSKMFIPLAVTLLSITLTGCGKSEVEVNAYTSKIQQVSDKYIKIICDNGGELDPVTEDKFEDELIKATDSKDIQPLITSSRNEYLDVSVNTSVFIPGGFLEEGKTIKTHSFDKTTEEAFKKNKDNFSKYNRHVSVNRYTS